MQACSDDDPATPPAALVDGGLDGSQPASEAAAPTPDAVAPDTSVDAPTGRGPVTIVVVDRRGAPLAGVKVAFYEGADVTVVATGSDGRAIREMAPGGNVMVADVQDGARRLTTIMAVEPNDVLTVTGGPAIVPPTEPIYATITFANVQPFNGATDEVQFRASCDVTSQTTGTAPPLQVPASCVSGGKVTILALSRLDTGIVQGYVVKEATVSGGGTTNVDITAAEWIAAVPGASSFSGTQPAFLNFADHTVSFFKNGRDYLSTPNDPMALSFTGIPYNAPPATFPDFVRSYTLLGFDYGADGGGVANFEPVSALIKQEAVVADAGVSAVARSFGDFLPRIHTLDFQTGPSQKATWQSDGAITAVGGTMYLTGSITQGDGSLESLEWYVTFPNGSSVDVPNPPAALAEFQPVDPLRLEFLALVDPPQPATYQTLRANAQRFLYLHTVDDTEAIPGNAAITTRVTAIRGLD